MKAVEGGRWQQKAVDGNKSQTERADVDEEGGPNEKVLGGETVGGE